MRQTCLLAAAAFVVSFAARADDKKADSKPFTESEFLTKAASGGMMEVELGKLAVAHAKMDEVKKFGQKMIDDHTKANDELKKVAEAAGVTVPAKMTADHQKHYDMLKGKSGGEFDKAYVEHMVKDHEEDVAEFTKASKEATTPAVRAFATKTLPTLKEHLEMVKKIHEKTK